MGTAIKHLVPDWVKPSFVWTAGNPVAANEELREIIVKLRKKTRPQLPERQSARMSKITNDGSTRSSTECFIAL